MPTSKPLSKVSSSTTALTGPLIVKIVATFGALVILLLLVGLTALYSLNNVNTARARYTQTQRELEYLTLLRADVLSFKNAAQLLNDTSQPESIFMQFADSFSLHSNYLAGNGIPLAALDNQKNQLVEQYQEALEAARIKNQADFTNHLNSYNQLTDDLLTKVEDFIHTWNGRAGTDESNARQAENDAVNLVVLIIFISLIITGLAVFFVLATVVRPLSGLNKNLTQLLWNQTEHLTDRLNLLQSEIDYHEEMLTATRHDLKAPLANIKGLSELTTLTHSELDAEVQTNLSDIAKISDKAVAMVSQQLARREMKLDLQEVSLDELIDKVLNLVDLRLYNVTRKVETGKAIMDAGLMEHALLNLVSNARKFSQLGIGVGARRNRKPGTLDQYEVELWVWNDGTVISAGDRAEIFKPGKQTEEGKKAGGHGLGLAIVKSIAERHHGRVHVESHEKVGTTFHIVIPELNLEGKTDFIGDSPAEPAVIPPLTVSG